MALLADDELSALQTQMAHTAAQASQPTYPLAPSVAPKEPTWVDSASGGYYDDGLGHYSNNGGNSWDYTPEPYAATSYAPPQPASTDPYGYNAPYVTPATAPGEYGNDTYAPPPQDNQGNPWLPTQGPNGGAYINNVGQFWDSETQSWADSSQPTALGNYYSDARGMPSYSDIAESRRAGDLLAGLQQDAWLNTSNAGREGSRYDRMGFQDAPTNRELVDWYDQQAESRRALGNVMDFAGQAIGATNFGAPDRLAAAEEEWRGVRGADPYSRAPFQWQQDILDKDYGGDINAATDTGFGLGGALRKGWQGIETAAEKSRLNDIVEAAVPFSSEQRAKGGRTQLPVLFGDLMSQEALQKNLGVDTSYMDWLREHGLIGKATAMLIDQGLAPATILTALAGPSVPLLGSTFSGGLGTRLAGEAAVNAAGMYLGEKGANKAAEYTDNPWIVGGAGLLGGLAGAGGVLGAAKAAKSAPGVVKAADRALTGIEAKVARGASPEFGGGDFTPGQIASGKGAAGSMAPDPSLKVKLGRMESLPMGKGKIRHVIVEYPDGQVREVGVRLDDTLPDHSAATVKAKALENLAKQDADTANRIARQELGQRLPREKTIQEMTNDEFEATLAAYPRATTLDLQKMYDDAHGAAVEATPAARATPDVPVTAGSVRDVPGGSAEIPKVVIDDVTSIGIGYAGAARQLPGLNRVADRLDELAAGTLDGATVRLSDTRIQPIRDRVTALVESGDFVATQEGVGAAKSVTFKRKPVAAATFEEQVAKVSERAAALGVNPSRGELDSLNGIRGLNARMDVIETMRTPAAPPTPVNAGLTPDAPVNAATATVRDVTPEGYGPGPQTNFDPAPRDRQFTTEVNRLRSSINEGETILRGKMTPEKRAAIERTVAASKQKLADMGYEVRKPVIDAEVSSAKPPSNPRAYDTPEATTAPSEGVLGPVKPRPVADAGGTPPPRIPGSTNEDPDFVSGTRKILDATTAEANIRRVGTADREIKGERAKQFGNILGTLNNEGDAADTLAAARRSAAVGTLRKTTAEAIDLTPGEKSAVLSDIIERVKNDELPPWAIFNATGADSALEKLLRGDGLQPAEIKWVRETFGDEVADAVRDRPTTAAQLIREDAKEQVASRAYSDKAIAKQHAQAQADLARENSHVASLQETSDRAVQRARWKTIARTNSTEEIQQRLADPFITAEERAIAIKAITTEANRAQNAAGGTVDAIWERAKKANPDAEDLKRRADALIDKRVADPRMNAEVKKTVALWESGNRVILDGIGENRVQEVAGSIGRMISGDVADSHLAALIHRRSYLQTALELQGLDPAVAKKAANVLLERELKIRYSGGIPDNIQEMLNSTKSLPYGEQGAIAGAASISQKMKNTQFGIGDMAVFGQQVLKAVTTGGVNLTAGLVNDMLSLLHLPHIRTLYAESNLPKMIQHQLDGVAQGAPTGITDLSHDGTLIGGFGPLGRAADKHVFVPFTKALTDFQFKTVLGTLRNLNHEGNLVLLKLGGQDINNPAVRAQAAAFANSNTSFWAPAQKSARAQAEKALLLSPSMRRAQIAQIRQVTKLLDGSGAERILAATTMASFGVSLLAVGKLVNDYVGIGDFEFDPSKPGFGSITVPNPFGGKNIVLNVFPQEQVLTAFAKAVRVLSENPDKAGSIDAAKEIGKLLLSSSSPAARIGESAVGFGYDPQESKYKFGDLGDGKSWVDRAINMAPIPPAATDLLRQGFDPARTPLGFLGVNNYRESDYQPRDRKAEEMFGVKYSDLPPTAATNGVYDPTKPSQRAVDEANGGKVESTFPETIARNKVVEANRTENVATQQAIDAKYIRPGATAPANYDDGKAWRGEKKILDYAIREQWKTLEKSMPYTGPESKNPMRLAMNAWGAEMDAAKSGTETDYDRVDKWMAEHPAEAALVNEYLAGKVNTDLTEVVTAKNAAAKAVGDSGFFDLRDSLWAELNAQSPATGYVAGQGYYDWRDALIEQTTQEMIASGVSPTIAATKAETAVDTKHPVVKKFNDVYKSKALYPWVDANPELANTAVVWGYLYPDTKIQKFFQSRDSK